jgi:hypothetical protein
MSDEQDYNPKMSRRDMLKTAALAGAGLGLTGLGFDREKIVTGSQETAGAATGSETMIGVKFQGYNTVRIGIIGVGGRGSSLLRDLLAIDHVRVNALCDIVQEKVRHAQKAVVDAGQKEPQGYSNGDQDYEHLCGRDDLDIIYIATPWDWHVPMALSGMKHGKHVAVEVPAATTLNDCWALVDMSEKTRRHCIMLENCCYGYNEMTVLNMIRGGIFGELTHGEAAYVHNLGHPLIADEGEGLWRRYPHMKRHGNLYPTHGLGPVARYMDVNRGDRFDDIVSISSLERGLTLYRDVHVPPDSLKSQENHICGNISTSVIRTVRGRTIMLQHDIINPRTYDRLNMITGTKGAFRDYPPRLYVDGQKEDDWTTLDAYKARYEDWLWTKKGEIAEKLGGHGGMDFIMNYRLIQCMRDGLVPDMDVYDAAAWSAPGPLSEMSVANSGATVKFPDFTRGNAMLRKT